MKKAEWQAVYAPQGDALERRVRTTLDGLADRPERAYPRRAVFVAAALVLALIAAAAVAAGLTRSARYDAKRLAYQALEEKYGFTQDMDSFFTLHGGENGTGRPSSPIAPTKMWAILRGSWAITPLRFGTVRLRRVGQTTAKRSATISPPMCGIRRCWRAASRGAKQERNGMKSRERRWTHWAMRNRKTRSCRKAWTARG